MKFVYGSTILVMLAMAIFGAFGAAHGMEHGGGCFAATAAGMPCMADVAESLNMHFSILRSFSTAVFAIAFAAALFAVFAYVGKTFAPPVSRLALVSRLRPFAIGYLLFANLLWIARLEHSPSLI